MTVFFLGMSISNALAHHIRSNNLLSVSRQGFQDWLEFGCWGYEFGLYWKGFCLLLLLVGEWSCLKSAFRNCCPIRGFRRVDEGLKALDFDFSVFFFFSALVSACRILLQSSESLPIGSFSYSVTAAQPPYVESAILVSLFLFFSLEMTAFNDVETGSCSSEMLSMIDCRFSIISLLNSRCSLWPFCLKVSTWIFRFFPAGSLSLFFLIWFCISWNLESK